VLNTLLKKSSKQIQFGSVVGGENKFLLETFEKRWKKGLPIFQDVHDLKFFNTFCADWRIYASFAQMDRVLNDAYMRTPKC